MKERLDIMLVNQGLSASRERAKATIMAGLVYVNEQKIDKAGTMVDIQAHIAIRGNQLAYVSRGGLKLEKAITNFGLNLTDKVMADIGASTGGFTDCALKNGALHVYAIDVGYGQLAWSLRNDKRVINMERTNIRNVTPADIGQLLDFATIDVAFISLGKVLPAVKNLLAPHGEIIALIKPQFEAGRENVGKKGVVRDPDVHRQVLLRILDESRSLELYPVAITFSPVKGPEGNIEYLVHLVQDSTCDAVNDKNIVRIVEESHSQLLG